MVESIYPPSAFYFKVIIGTAKNLADTAFQEVSGIGAQMDLEPYSEGGENRFIHQLPKAIKHQNLVLKRGIASEDSRLVVWCQTVLEGDFSAKIEPQDVVVYLMNENKEPIRAWAFSNAFPVTWDVEAFNSTKSEVAIEKIELSYNNSNRII